MNKSESKYFHTALLMDEALMILLLKKDIDYITVKEICQKAGVNRSTFYLHYDKPADILVECNEIMGKRLSESMKAAGVITDFSTLDSFRDDELVLLDERYFRPYVSFLRENRLVFRAIYRHPELFGTSRKSDLLFEHVFLPIIQRMGVPEKDGRYMTDFFLNGISAVLRRWVNDDCRESDEKILALILQCVGPLNVQMKSSV